MFDDVELEYIQKISREYTNTYLNMECSPLEDYHSKLISYVNYLENNPTIKSILEDLISRNKDVKIDDDTFPYLKYFDFDLIQDPEKHIITAYLVFKACSESDIPFVESLVGCSGIFGEDFYKYEFDHLYLYQGMDSWGNTFSLILNRYIHKILFNQLNILKFLISYKKKYEYEDKNQLFQIIKEKDSEKKLSNHIYNYLNSINERDYNYISPILSSNSESLIFKYKFLNFDEYLIINTIKIFDNINNKKESIIQSFKNIYQITIDNKIPFGFLIIFNISGNALKLPTTDKNILIPHIRYNNKTIYIIEISPLNDTEPKKNIITITENEFIT